MRHDNYIYIQIICKLIALLPLITVTLLIQLFPDGFIQTRSAGVKRRDHHDRQENLFAGNSSGELKSHNDEWKIDGRSV